MSIRPNLLFFSGGTGPKELSRLLAASSISSVHIISTFDSGRSSKSLRRAFAIPALGDLRNRLLALADTTKTPASVLDFLSFRLPANGNSEYLRECLLTLDKPDNEAWAALAPNERRRVYEGMHQFLLRMPQTFDPFNASLGNLVLAGAYLEAGRNFEPAIRFFADLVHAVGIVMPICSENLHLAAELEDGGQVMGQDNFKNLSCKIRRLFLTVHEPRADANFDETPCHPPLYEPAKKYLESCDLICFPMGSFYSSILANTLVKGVGKAVAQNPCPKIFIPNSGYDPEAVSINIAEQARLLIKSLTNDTTNNKKFLDYILVDDKNGLYPGGMDTAILNEIARLGIEIIFCPIVDRDNPNRHNPCALLEEILKIANQ